ncbi:hypothetical protein GH714_043108 [Hevea brasiliensis]|uniref:Uncharacterized protein n=1 Tax=Hevea brasiliensis TaxID=3981 RepID=A0A6A6K2F8_HEVBR|nr:hypothetical protein GH714_043108 [Hevea brasiliensis]
MACETAKEAWDLLKAEFQGSALSKQMSVLNLRREFEVLKMKESETLKEYTDRLMTVVNKIKLLEDYKKYVSIHKESSSSNEEGRPVESDVSQEMDYEDNERVQKTKPLFEIYERCNLVFAEPINYQEASSS